MLKMESNLKNKNVMRLNNFAAAVAILSVSFGGVKHSFNLI